MTLTDFLLERLAEDEAGARAASPGPWRSSIEGRDHFGGDDVILTAADHDLYPRVMVDGRFNSNFDNDQDHIARHDPARVLAEVAAKRAIVAEHQRIAPTVELCGVCSEPGDYDDSGWLSWPCPTLRALASVYRDHPDYDEGWAL